MRNSSDYSQVNTVRALFWSSALSTLCLSLKTKDLLNLMGFFTDSKEIPLFTYMPGLKAKGE